MNKEDSMQPPSRRTPPPQKKDTLQPPPITAPKQPSEQEPPNKPGIVKIAELQRMNIEQLNQYGKTIGLKNIGSLTKSQAVFEVVKTLSLISNDIIYGEGVLEILPDGFGFLRSPNYKIGRIP